MQAVSNTIIFFFLLKNVSDLPFEFYTNSYVLSNFSIKKKLLGLGHPGTEGVLSVGRSFLNAGAASVIWRVDDDVTQKLVIRLCVLLL